MELHQYTGEPTEQEIEQRLELWQKTGGYKKDRLRIHHQCPCCKSDKDTEWIRQVWNICYNCFISFTLDDLIPVCEAGMLQPYDPDEEQNV